jgi:hypothetical protein
MIFCQVDGASERASFEISSYFSIIEHISVTSIHGSESCERAKMDDFDFSLRVDVEVRYDSIPQLKGFRSCKEMG